MTFGTTLVCMYVGSWRLMPPRIYCSRLIVFRHSNPHHQVSLTSHDARDPSSETWNYFPTNLAQSGDFHSFFRDFLHAANMRHGTDSFTSPPLKNMTASVCFEPANLGTKGQHATSRPLKQLTSAVSKILHSVYFSL